MGVIILLLKKVWWVLRHEGPRGLLGRAKTHFAKWRQVRRSRRLAAKNKIPLEKRKDTIVLRDSSPCCETVDFDQDSRTRIAVHVHLYYMELMDEIIRVLNHIPYVFDCYVSTDTPAHKTEITTALEAHCKCRKVYVETFINRGRDVAPFLVQMAPVINQYDYICHIHSKRTKTTEYGDNWRSYLFRHLLGSEAFLKRLFTQFERDKRLGVIFPVSYPPLEDILAWENNREGVSHLLARIGYNKKLPDPLTFPAGNMLWVRSKAVKALFDLGLQQTDFPEEAGQVDETLAHCVERVWVYVAQKAGYHYKKVFNSVTQA